MCEYCNNSETFKFEIVGEQVEVNFASLRIHMLIVG